MGISTSSLFAAALSARIAAFAHYPKMWECLCADLASQNDNVATALAGMNKPGRSGWKVRRQQALVGAVVEAQYVKALWRGEALAQRMGLESKDGAAYAQVWTKVWAENVFGQGAEALADSKAVAVLEARQTQVWIAKVDAGVPVVADGLALLGLAIAYAAWLELGEEVQKESRLYTGMTEKSCDLRDTHVLVGAERRLVGNWLASVKTLCALWAGVSTVMERNGLFEFYADQASKGYGLKDVNPFFNNCGHYPEWKVVVGGAYKSRAEAQAVAARKNAVSQAEWNSFLNA